MTHHFLRAAQLTPAEIKFREQHQAARERINAAGDAYLKRLNQVSEQEAAARREKAIERAAAIVEKIQRAKIPILICDPVKPIQKLTCEAFGIDLAELMSQRRERKLVMARQIAMYLCKRFTSQSFPYIGRRFGGRDHTTVLYGCKRVEEMLALAPSQRAAGWSARDCQLVRDKVAEITAAYLKSLPSEDQP